MEINDVTYLIRGAAFRVFKKLGPGLLESIYQRAMIKELVGVGLSVEVEKDVDIEYDGENLGVGLRLDLLVENKVVVELKSVKKIENVHHMQLLTYLKLTKKKVGLLINFNVEDIAKGIYRKVN